MHSVPTSSSELTGASRSPSVSTASARSDSGQPDAVDNNDRAGVAEDSVADDEDQDAGRVPEEDEDDEQMDATQYISASQVYYQVKGILSEKGNLYLIAWEGTDPATGKAWKPSWERKSKDSPTLDVVRAWKEKQKLLKQPRKTEKESAKSKRKADQIKAVADAKRSEEQKRDTKEKKRKHSAKLVDSNDEDGDDGGDEVAEETAVPSKRRRTVEKNKDSVRTRTDSMERTDDAFAISAKEKKAAVERDSISCSPIVSDASVHSEPTQEVEAVKKRGRGRPSGSTLQKGRIARPSKLPSTPAPAINDSDDDDVTPPPLSASARQRRSIVSLSSPARNQKLPSDSASKKKIVSFEATLSPTPSSPPVSSSSSSSEAIDYNRPTTRHMVKQDHSRVNQENADFVIIDDDEGDDTYDPNSDHLMESEMKPHLRKLRSRAPGSQPSTSAASAGRNPATLKATQSEPLLSTHPQQSNDSSNDSTFSVIPDSQHYSQSQPLPARADSSTPPAPGADMEVDDEDDGEDDNDEEVEQVGHNDHDEEVVPDQGCLVVGDKVNSKRLGPIVYPLVSDFLGPASSIDSIQDADSSPDKSTSRMLLQARARALSTSTVVSKLHLEPLQLQRTSPVPEAARFVEEVVVDANQEQGGTVADVEDQQEQESFVESESLEYADVNNYSTRREDYAAAQEQLRALGAKAVVQPNLQHASSTNPLPTTDSLQLAQSVIDLTATIDALRAELVVEQQKVAAEVPARMDASAQLESSHSVLLAAHEELKAAHKSSIEEVASLVEKIAVLDQRCQASESSKASALEDFEYMQAQYHEASSIAAARSRDARAAEAQVEGLEKSLDIGLRQRDLFQQGQERTLIIKIDRLEMEATLLREESARTMVIRTKASKWDDFVREEERRMMQMIQDQRAKEEREREDERRRIERQQQQREDDPSEVEMQLDGSFLFDADVFVTSTGSNSKNMDTAVLVNPQEADVSDDDEEEAEDDEEDGDDEDDPMVFQCLWRGQSNEKCRVEGLASRELLQDHITVLHTPRLDYPLPASPTLSDLDSFLD